MFRFCCFDKKKLNYNLPVIQMNDGTDYSYLKNIELNDTIQYIPSIDYGKTIKVYDGDTITICAKYPYDNSPIYRFQVRLNGIDSAEIRSKTQAEKAKAIEARDALHNLIYGKIIHLKNKTTEKWGRILADVYLGDLHVNKWMLDNNYAIAYNGGTKQHPEEWN